MSDKTDDETPADAQDEDADNNAKSQQKSSKKDDVPKDTDGDDVVDDEQFEKNFNENKAEIALLLTVFDTHSHLMKALTAIQLWGHVLGGKCAIQKIIRPLAPILSQMEEKKELDSPLPNPKNLSPEDTKQLRKLWDKTNDMPAPTGLEALASMKEKMKYDSFRDIYLAPGRKIYYHFKILNPTMDSIALKDQVIQEFGKCESKRDLENAFDAYEKKRRQELGLKTSSSSSNNNCGSNGNNGNNYDDSKDNENNDDGDGDDDENPEKNENNNDDDGDGDDVEALEENELAQASSPRIGRSGLREKSKLQLDSLALACVSPSPAKKRKKTKTTKTKTLLLLWDLTPPKLNQTGKSLDPKWVEVAQFWVFVVLPFCELMLTHCENAGKTKFNVLKQHDEDEKKRKRVARTKDKVLYNREKASIDLTKHTWDGFNKLHEKFNQSATEQFHVTSSTISFLISIGMIEANAETNEEMIKSLNTWIRDKKVRIELYRQLRQIDIMIRLKKTSEFVNFVNQEASVDRERVVATIKRLEITATD